MTHRDDIVMDMEANHFAMCLLMPEKFLRADIEKMGGIDICDDVAVEKLAKRYQVPVATMALRLGQLMGRRMIPAEHFSKQERPE